MSFVVIPGCQTQIFFVPSEVITHSTSDNLTVLLQRHMMRMEVTTYEATDNKHNLSLYDHSTVTLLAKFRG